MNKKGFTLVELLAVVVILGLIGLVAVPAVSKSIRDAKEDKNAINVDTILNAAYDYAQQNLSVLPSSVTGEVGDKICAQQLICSGLLKESIIQEVDDFTNHSIIVTYYETVADAPSDIDNNSKFFGNYLFTYQVDNACHVTCTAATSS